MTVSILGAVLAMAYGAIAVFIVAQDRAPGGGGNWISLRGMSSYIVTMPVSASFELMGAKLDYRKSLHMGIAIGVCALIAYGIGALVEWVVATMLAPR